MSSGTRCRTLIHPMGDVRSSADPEDDESSQQELPGSSPPPLCSSASYLPIICMCSRRSKHPSSGPSSPTTPPDADASGTTTADGPPPPIERRPVRDRNGRILFYYAPLPSRLAVETVGCRVSLCKSRSAGEIPSTSTTMTSRQDVNRSSRFAVPLQVRRRQLDDIRRRLAAVDVDDAGDGWRCGRPCSDEAASGTRGGASCHLDDRVSCNRQDKLMDVDDADELDRHRKQRRQRLQQAVNAVPPGSADIGHGVRRGGSLESDGGSRSDRDGSTDGSASTSTDTDHDHAFSVPVSLRLRTTIHYMQHPSLESTSWDRTCFAPKSRTVLPPDIFLSYI